MLESTAEICFPKVLRPQGSGMSSSVSKPDLPRAFLVPAKLKYHLEPN
jgi:hypothetical protein